MHCELIVLSITLLVGGGMAWAIGANDVANAMASTVGSKILTVGQAIFIAAVFEAAGALLASGQVTNMIRGGLVDVALFQTQPELFICGMLSALMAAATWLIVATVYGLPVSTTHSIVGAIIGFGVVSVGYQHIHWGNIMAIAGSWVATPIISMLVTAVLFGWLQHSLLSSKYARWQCRLQIPLYTAAVCLVFAYVIVFEGLGPLGVVLSAQTKGQVLMVIGGLALIGGSYQVEKRLAKEKQSEKKGLSYSCVEEIFASLAVITASSMAFSHGANDVANAIGPIAAVVSTLGANSVQQEGYVIPFWLVSFGAGAIVLGLAMYGVKIMETVGDNITQLTPLRGFCVQFSTSSIVIIASGLGLPVSTTQTMVGAVLGVGFMRGMHAINLSVVSNILLSWAVTLPVGALLTMFFYTLIQWGSSWYGYVCHW